MILNLTQHPATADQLAAGVVDLPELALAELRRLLTFNDLPSAEEILERASLLADIAMDEGVQVRRAMIGGARCLMAPLAAALRASGIDPVVA